MFLVHSVDWEPIEGLVLMVPDLWFSEAHFESRNEVKLEGQGKKR